MSNLVARVYILVNISYIIWFLFTFYFKGLRDGQEGEYRKHNRVDE